MKAGQQKAHPDHGEGQPYVLRRGLGTWEVTFTGERDSFADELGAEYVVWLLLHPPPEPMHAVTLALKVRAEPGSDLSEAEALQQRSLALDDAEAMREWRRRVRELEAVLEDESVSEAEKAEVRQQREQILEYLSSGRWRTRENAQKAVKAITTSIKRLQSHLADGVDGDRNPHPVLKAFAGHLWDYLLVPSGKAGPHGGLRAFGLRGGCFTYQPPPGVVWIRAGV